MQLVCFRVGTEEYGIDIMRVREVVQPLPLTPVADGPAHLVGVAELRGHFLGVMDLRTRLGASASGSSESGPGTSESGTPRSSTPSSGKIVIVDRDARPFGLVVDQVTEVRRVEPGQLASLAEAAPGGRADRFLTGVARFPGGVVLILDVDKLLAA